MILVPITSQIYDLDRVVRLQMRGGKLEFRRVCELLSATSDCGTANSTAK
jgi:hypothetical protein